LIALYELHLAAGDATRTIDPPKHDAPLATAKEFELFFADAERALVAIDFFKTRYPEHILRSIRSLAHRAGPDSREITLLRAAAIEVVRSLDRANARRAPA
jgi:tRNA/rRNA methyltransferase/tRNA (cytidine32/uridine32-2'-O)-methyltransferase